MDKKLKLSALMLCAVILLCVTVPLVSEVSAERPALPAETTTEAITDTIADTTASTSTDVDPPDPPSTTDGETVPPSTQTVAVFIASENKVVEMPLEDYIVCVVSAEMPYTFHTEALKAQAIAARTYCIYKMSSASHENGAEICTDHSHCAAYVSREELVKRYGETVTKSIITKITDAVRQTEGQILTYGGEPILAVFHSRSYLRTESSKNIWGGDLPYLRSVSTPEADSITAVTLTDGQMSELFSSESSIPVGDVGGALISSRNDSGRVDSLTLGGKAVKAKLLRSLFGFRSTSFEYERVEGGWLFTVHGYGHGVGMSQYGANEMAKNGWDCYSILTHYYSGVTVTDLSCRS